MKISFIILLFMGVLGFSQQSDPSQKKALKKKILLSNEVKEWQNAMIAHQKSRTELCAVKYELRLDQILLGSCGKSQISESFEKLTLNLFRTLRITNELRDVTVLKEKILRTKYPQLATHFEFGEIFPELYKPIRKAREAYLEKAR